MSTIFEVNQRYTGSNKTQIQNFSFKKQKYSHHDVNDALELANFIGLSPVSRIKRRLNSKVQTFFRTNNLSLNEEKIKSSQKIIQNDLNNRQINYFDFQKILCEKKKRLILQKSNHFFKQNPLNIKVQSRQKRTHSQRILTMSNGSKTKECFEQKINKRQKNKLKVKTARQLKNIEKLRFQKNSQIQNYLEQIHRSKLRRQKILNETFKNFINLNKDNQKNKKEKSIQKRQSKIYQKFVYN